MTTLTANIERDADGTMGLACPTCPAQSIFDAVNPGPTRCADNVGPDADSSPDMLICRFLDVESIEDRSEKTTRTINCTYEENTR